MATIRRDETTAAPGAALASQVLAGQVRALARALSWVEDGHPLKDQLLASLAAPGRAYRVGVTGPPGAGKSTLVDGLISRARAHGFRVAVVAVDPTSPFTGGALLGDRVRMTGHTLDPGVFIRSVGSRGSLGGLAAATGEMLQVLDAAGFDLILVETVGVGQSEWAVARLADTTVLVLTPASGDGIQGIKAGIMEIADIYIVNKADLPGAHQAVADVQASLPPPAPDAWAPPVLPVVATEGTGMDDAWQAIQAHRRYLEADTRASRERRLARVRHELARLALAELQARWDRYLEGELEAAVAQVARGAEAAGQAARRLVERFLTQSPHRNGRRGNNDGPR
ncbi:MAG TPA: methylmalonyl Co-A mutase-associated GTPase MeaB [Limnochorda sp.]